MSTFKQLTDQVLQNLQGDTLDQTEQTFVSSPVSATDLTFTVDEPRLISQGVCEMGEELVWVKKVDNATSQVTVSPLGRGYRSTNAIAHPVGTTITNNPRYSRFRVKQAINLSTKNVYPDLYQVKYHEFPYVAARLSYELPADVDQVHNITWEAIGPSRTWIFIDRWNYVPDADPSRFPSGKALDLWDNIMPGRTVRVTYIKQPDFMVNDTDDFVTTTGLAVTAEESIIYGACWRLCGFIDPPRLQVRSIESTLRAAAVPPGSGQNLGQFFYNLYTIAVAQERERQLRSNRSIKHYRGRGAL